MSKKICSVVAFGSVLIFDRALSSAEVSLVMDVCRQLKKQYNELEADNAELLEAAIKAHDWFILYGDSTHILYGTELSLLDAAIAKATQAAKVNSNE